MPEQDHQNLSKEQKKKKMLAHLSQRVHASSPLPKNNTERKLQTKLDALMHRLQDETVTETTLVDLLTEYALTLQEQAEHFSGTKSAVVNEKGEEVQDENEDVVEGLHAKACVAYEFASKWKERYTIYYNWAIAVGDRARVLERKRPEEARILWREACEKYEKAVEVGMSRSYLRGGGEGGEMVTPMSVSRALNNHGLALRQRAMLMTDSETEESSNTDESKSKCLSEAILKFRRAIRISSDFHRAAYNLGTVEFARGEMEAAAVYVFSALAMVTSALPSSSETENTKVVYSQSAQLVETALPDTQCGDDPLFAGNVWFAGGVGGKRRGEDTKNKRRTTITDFDWARRRFAVCASAFKTVDSAQTFRIKSESGDYVPSRNDAWGDDAAPDTHFNVNLPMLSVESCEPISDISRPPNCFAFLLYIRDDLKDSEKENDDKDSPPAVVRHYRFACETESERDVWVDAIALLASLAKRGKAEHLKSVLLSLKAKRKKRVGFV